MSALGAAVSIRIGGSSIRRPTLPVRQERGLRTATRIRSQSSESEGWRSRAKKVLRDIKRKKEAERRTELCAKELLEDYMRRRHDGARDIPPTRQSHGYAEYVTELVIRGIDKAARIRRWSALIQMSNGKTIDWLMRTPTGPKMDNIDPEDEIGLPRQ